MNESLAPVNDWPDVVAGDFFPFWCGFEENPATWNPQLTLTSDQEGQIPALENPIDWVSSGTASITVRGQAKTYYTGYFSLTMEQTADLEGDHYYTITITPGTDQTQTIGQGKIHFIRRRPLPEEVS